MPSQATQVGQVCRVVAKHIEPLTRFDASHLHELEPERIFGLSVQLTLEQQLSFSIGRSGGRGPLNSNTEKLENVDAFRSELDQRLKSANEDGQLALTQWADEEVGSYRRLMPATAGFLCEPNHVGYEHVCNSCKGDRKLTCAKCNGRGTISCHGCNANGWVYCNACNGTKRSFCYVCSGRGQTAVQVSRQYRDHQGYWQTAYDTKYHNCTYCSGTGRCYCNSCDDGTVTCPTCDGDGRLNCSPCRATGKVDCVGCDATGIEHEIGIIKSEIQKNELITVDTDNQILSKLVLNKIPRESLPSLGELHKVTHQSNGLILSTVHQIRLDVREAKIQAMDEAFVIYGFGPDAEVFDFKNVAGRLLEDDIGKLEQQIKNCSRWGWRREGALLDATADFLRSELNILIAERISETKNASAKVSKRIEQEYRGLVDPEYPSRASLVLKSALQRIYGSELLEPTVYLTGLVGLLAALSFLFGWPMPGYEFALIVACFVGLIGWIVLEWITYRRIGRRFEGELGGRVLVQLKANGSVRKWRVRAALAIVLVSVISILISQKSTFLHIAEFTNRSSVSPQQELINWDRQGPDFRLRTYPSRFDLETLLAQGDEKARLVLAWQLLLGADGANKDVEAAARHLANLPRLAKRGDPLWRSAKALLVINQESKPDAIKGAAAELKLAGSNLVEARYWYARILLSEKGPMFDAQKGIDSLKQSADDNHAHAALMLGEHLAVGKHVTRDVNLARRYLERARDAGLREAVRALSELK